MRHIPGLSEGCFRVKQKLAENEDFWDLLPNYWETVTFTEVNDTIHF